jgi:SagB-type dehydrogenase family enzyme
MSSFLSRLHADLRQTRLTKRGATHLPENVPQGLHKVYARMKQIPLNKPKDIDISLTDALISRTSSLRDSGRAQISLSECSALLGHGLRKHPQGSSRNYPSGGALFPIETYLIATSLEDAGPGVFHYNPTAHVLEKLWDLPQGFSMKECIPNPDYLSPSVLLVFTSVWGRSSAKYGDFTYGLALLEAGHMSENILLLATALDLEVRPMAGFDDARITELLDINKENEQPVHTVTLSKENDRS